MTTLISTPLIQGLAPPKKPMDIRDARVRGFILRVQPSGVKTYYVEYGRGKRKKIGPEAAFKPDEARTEARKVLAAFHKGEDPKANKLNQSVSSFGEFIKKAYEPWALGHLKHGKVTCGRIRRNYEQFLKWPLAEMSPHKVEKWRSKRLEGGTKPTTVNRDLNDLRAALTKAVTWGFLDEHPLHSVRPSLVDDVARCRFLDEDEMKRLRKALDAREDRMRNERRSANEWRKKRSKANERRKERPYKLLPNLDDVVFADYLKPMVLLSLNTGMRRGELFALTWEALDFDNSNLTVAGGYSKSGKTRHLPLNSEALSVLQGWQSQTKGNRGLVFKNKNDKKFDNVGSSWGRVLSEAEIEDFRWHDLRHTFASKLVMAGVDLNTVRELLGHSDYNMTLRYAHLAPSHKAKAVEMLVG